jgi:phospholipid/cholesterol/gamma-HCH transport system permease protein
MLTAIIITSAVGASFAIAVGVNGVASGSFWNSFGTFSSAVDVWFTIGKSLIFAALVAVISCLRGMEAKGGPRGVADAVNSSVVINVLLIACVNLGLTQLQTMFFPTAVS